MEKSLSQEYKYKSVPLSPAILADIIPILFEGKLAETKTIFDAASSYHISKGGKKSNASGNKSTTDKAFQILKRKGLADSPSRGYWRIAENKSSFDELVNSDLQISAELVDDDFPIEKVEMTEIADTVLGEGKSAVYVYYLPLYLLAAKSNNEPFWPCKIGRTDGDPLQRILSQASTALPERPHVAIVIKTDFPGALENSIHSILTLRGRKIDSSPGTEWYLTSPEEVLSIVDFIQSNESSAKVHLVE